MIHYDLRCAAGHGFDGWFRNSAAFDQQARAGLLECPVCASAAVSRAIMAPRLSRGAMPPALPAPAIKPAPGEAGAGKRGADPVVSNKGGTDKTSTPAPADTAVGGPPPMPDRVRALLQRIRAEVEQKCDYVGPRFAEAARAMHDGQVSARPIYGETTPDEAEALAEDGIEVASIPWVPRADG